MALAPVSSTLKWRCRYWLICTCIDGKMRTCASCSVLSRSKIHTRRDGGRLAMRMGVPLLASDQGTDTLVGQNFEEQRVRHAPVDDVHALHAVPRCVECRADLRNHAARDDPFRHQVVDLFGVRPVRSSPSLSSTPGVLVSTTSFSALRISASLPATRSALML